MTKILNILSSHQHRFWSFGYWKLELICDLGFEYWNLIHFEIMRNRLKR
jgi:hypothetical protein